MNPSDLKKAQEALQKADVPCRHLRWSFTGTEEEYEDFIRSFDPKERTMNVNPNNPTPAQVDKFLRDDADFFDALKVSADDNGEPLLDETNRLAIEGKFKVPGNIYVTADEGEEDKPTVH